MYMKLWGLKFPFQKHILLHYLPNRPQLYSFFDSLSSEARIQGIAAPKNDIDSKAKMADRTEAEGRMNYRVNVYSQAMISSYLVVYNLITIGSGRGRKIFLYILIPPSSSFFFPFSVFSFSFFPPPSPILDRPLWKCYIQF